MIIVTMMIMMMGVLMIRILVLCPYKRAYGYIFVKETKNMRKEWLL